MKHDFTYRFKSFIGNHTNVGNNKYEINIFPSAKDLGVGVGKD